MANIEALADMSGELKPKEREPMLSDRAVSHLAYSDMGIRLARAFYESLITTGKLRAVGTVKRLQVQEHPHGFLDRCSGCTVVLSQMDVWCPGCGEKIEA